MRSVSAFIEIDVGMAYDSGTAAWVFDLDLWGRCGQGTNERRALDDLNRKLGDDIDLEVVERIWGDEQAFQRDRVRAPPTSGWRRLRSSTTRARRQSRYCTRARRPNWTSPSPLVRCHPSRTGTHCARWAGTSPIQRAVTTCHRWDCHPSHVHPISSMSLRSRPDMHAPSFVTCLRTWLPSKMTKFGRRSSCYVALPGTSEASWQPSGKCSR